MVVSDKAGVGENENPINIAMVARVLQIGDVNGLLPDKVVASDSEEPPTDWQIETVDGLGEALVRLAAESFDLVVLNFGSVQADDLVSIRRLRVAAPGVPILALTTDRTEATSIAVLSVVDDCILVGTGEMLFWRAARLAVERRRYRDAVDECRQREIHQRELVGLEGMGGHAALTVAARSFGVGALDERMPRAFADVVTCYAKLLDSVLDHRSCAVSSDLAERLSDLIDRVGGYGAGPRDLIAIHKAVIARLTQAVSAERARAYVEEGRMLLLQAMGYLVSYYRHLSWSRPCLRYSAPSHDGRMVYGDALAKKDSK